MSLDISLIAKEPITKKAYGIFIREGGATIEISAEEWNRRNPDRKVDVEIQEYETYDVYETNITHNLGKMAGKAGIYEALWRPHRLKADYNIPENDHNAEYEYESKSHTEAREIISIVEKGLADLRKRPDYYKQFSAENGWGTYEQFVPWVAKYLNALKEYPNAKIECGR